MDKKKIILVICFLFFIFIIWFVFIKNKIFKKIIIEKPTYLHSKYIKEISGDNLPKSEHGIKFTYSFWLYLKNIPENGHWFSKYGTYNYILFRFGSPDVVFYPKDKLLRIFMTYKNDISDVVKDSIDIEDLTLQKWHHIVIVLNNKNLDTYVNGEIYNSIILKNVPFIYDRPLLIGRKKSNFNGHVAKLEYYNDDLDHNQINDLYNNNKNNLPKDMLSYSEEYYINKSQL